MMRVTVDLDFGADRQKIPLGVLGRDGANRKTAFEWDSAFAAQPLNILPFGPRRYDALLTPDMNRRATLPGLFEDSLPDGWGRLLLDREIAARGISRSAIGDLERLAYVGANGAGALTYRPEIGFEPMETIDLAWFEDTIPQVEDGASAADLSRLRVISGGSQGARPKFVAQLGPDGHSLRDHRTPLQAGWTHVLIKGRASVEPIGVIEAELAYGDLMGKAGIKTSQMRALQGDKEAFFCTVRFDRPDGRRLHLATVSGLLDIGMSHGVVDYVDLVKMAKLLGGAQDAEEIFRRMVFNLRAFNRDDHVRNHGFLMDGTGIWSLAPAYDVSFSDGPGGEHSISVAGEGRMPGLRAIADVARIAGIKPTRRDQIIAQVDAALDQWPDVAQAHNVPSRLQHRIKTEISAARIWK